MPAVTMQERTVSAAGRLVANKLNPGVFVVEVPEAGRRISLGQPPDVVKRLQQVGYSGRNGVDTFVLVDTKIQGDSISWCLVEFPVLYALYFVPVDVGGKTLPAFFAGRYPTLVGLENDVRKAMRMVKYGNYGVDDPEEFDAMDVPPATRDAMRSEILGLAVGNEVKDSSSFLRPVYLEPSPRSEREFSDLGDGISVGRVAHNTYRFLYNGDSLEVCATLAPGERFRSPVEYKHLKFPVMNFGIWHTGEYDGMDPYYSAQHTTIIHKYEPFPVDFPSNMTEVLNHHGLSKQSVRTVIATHNHDDHIGALVELFRRSQHCRVVTTEPVRYSIVRKLAALVDLPVEEVQSYFEWTLLPFRAEQPFQTETLNLEGLHITGHLSCHSVPTTVYTFRVNNDGYTYSYGHFLDLVAFRRMEQLVADGWMPQAHLDYLDRLVRRTAYNLIKYDVGCTTDASLPFTVHAQWQDLVGSATQRSFRVFSHASREALDPAFEREGRFVSLGDLDAALLSGEDKLIRLGAEKSAVTAFFMQAYRCVVTYLESLLDVEPGSGQAVLINHYASAFANCPKQADPNVGAFLYEQDSAPKEVIFIVRGRAEITEANAAGEVAFSSNVGDGEVLGDEEVLAGRPRFGSAKALNRLSYLAVPASLFAEAMDALGIGYEGRFRDLFERRRIFRSVPDLARDVSTTAINAAARSGRLYELSAGQPVFSRGDPAASLYVVTGAVELEVEGVTEALAGPTVVGECEFFLGSGGQHPERMHSATARSAMQALELDSTQLRGMPVVVDNVRRIVRTRRTGIYGALPQLDPRLRIPAR